MAQGLRYSPRRAHASAGSNRRPERRRPRQCRALGRGVRYCTESPGRCLHPYLADLRSARKAPNGPWSGRPGDHRRRCSPTISSRRTSTWRSSCSSRGAPTDLRAKRPDHGAGRGREDAIPFASPTCPRLVCARRGLLTLDHEEGRYSRKFAWRASSEGSESLSPC
jgi:hypothetical protein